MEDSKLLEGIKRRFLKAVKEVVGEEAEYCRMIGKTTYFSVVYGDCEMLRVRTAGKARIAEWVVDMPPETLRETHPDIPCRPGTPGMGNKCLVTLNDGRDAEAKVGALREYVLSEYEKCLRSPQNVLVSDYTVIDIETTGQDVNSCEIIELSAVRIRNGVIDGEFSTLIKPRLRIPYFITELTGISNDMVKNAPDIAEMLPDLLDFIGGDTILGHNVKCFDCRIINRYCRSLGLPELNCRIVDTLHFSRRCRMRVRDHKLTTLTSHFRIPHDDAHRALADCIANYRCYEKMKPLYLGVPAPARK